MSESTGTPTATTPDTDQPVTGAAPGRTAGGPGDRLVRIGAVVFAVGTVATLVTVTPLLVGAHALPTAAYLVSCLMPVGFLVAFAGLFRSARGQRRTLPH